MFQISPKIESLDWVDRPQNFKGLYGILQRLQGSHLDNFPLKTLKLDWVAFHAVAFQLKCLDFQSNQYKKLVPVLSCFCNGLLKSSLLLFTETGTIHTSCMTQEPLSWI